MTSHIKNNLIVEDTIFQMFASQQLSLTDAVVMAMQFILLPHDDNTSPLQQPLPMAEDGNSMTNQICRVVAELETRACMVLALYLQDIAFAKDFIQHCGSTIDMLKSLAKDCSTGKSCGPLPAGYSLRQGLHPALQLHHRHAQVPG